MAFNPKQAMKEEWRNWHEDYSHENGQYFCVCGDCGATFSGHKRRPICKACYVANLEKQNAELAKALDLISELNDIESECAQCPLYAEIACRQEGETCNQAIIQWAKQQAKEAE